MGKVVCELIFVSDVNGREKYIYKKVRAKSHDSFSIYYYENRNRTLNSSLNLIVDKILTKDIEKNGNIFELRLLTYGAKDNKYKIKNILPYKEKKRFAILDCEEYE